MDGENVINVDDVHKSMKTFGTADYVVFMFMMLMCTLIGVYFGYMDHRKRQSNKSKPRRGSEELDYLVGGRKMKIFPVAMSLVASGLSGIALLGMPSDVYFYGINFFYILLPLTFTPLFVHYVIIPVFYDLQIVSVNDYLNKRFDNKVRLFGSIFFLLTNILLLPIVIYVPAMSLAQTTGMNVHVISIFVCLVCIFYTLVGGIKAVVWTDVIQVVLMFGALILVIFTGIVDVGGISVLIERNYNGGRLDLPEFTLDLTERQSALALFIGGTSFTLNMFGGQAMIQRYMSLPSIKAARKALLWNIAGIVALIAMCCVNGLIIYAKYYDCDPLTTKLVTARDQLLPLLVMENMNHIPGFAGLFIAGVFSASLSTLSTALNSAAAVVLEDFVKPIATSELSERKTSFIMRATVFVLGTISVLLVSVVQRLGGVLQLVLSITSASVGPLFGLFFIGFFMPWIRAKGAMIGSVLSFIISMYIAIRAQTELASGELYYETKSTSVEGCSYNFTRDFIADTTTVEPETPEDNSFEIHHISYFYYSFLGSLITIIIGYVVSLFCGESDPTTVDLNLLAPCIRKYFKRDDYGDSKMEITEHVFDAEGKQLQLITDFKKTPLSN